MHTLQRVRGLNNLMQREHPQNSRISERPQPPLNPILPARHVWTKAHGKPCSSGGHMGPEMNGEEEQVPIIGTKTPVADRLQLCV